MGARANSDRRSFLKAVAAAAAGAIGLLGLRRVFADGPGESRPAASGALPGTGEGKPDYLAAVRSHLDRIIASGTDRYGPVQTPMWMASLDTRTGAYPQDAVHPKVGKRAYRDILAPKGCTLYWDQPELVAAYAITKITADEWYAKAADAYVQSFLRKCVRADGLFEWGNHVYYDAFTDKLVHLQGGDHETRPIPPAWEAFWKLSPQAAEREIRLVAKLHVFDPVTGGFNRHADGKKGCAFLESGGIITETLCWLSRKTGDKAPADLALRVARFSFEHRGEKTGLLENNPTVSRWDKFAATTEVGVWAGSLLRAQDYTGVEEFGRMARQAVLAYLKYGWDEKAGRYLGQLKVADGVSAFAAENKRLPETNAPGLYADPWNAYFPTHDYPMALAETCVTLYDRTKEREFLQAIERWAGVLKEEKLPAQTRDGHGGYAELFGRGIHFLCRAAEATGDRAYRKQAHELARLAMDSLFAEGMFRSHTGEDRYDALDGVGYLLLALIRLQTGKAPDYMGFGF